MKDIKKRGVDILDFYYVVVVGTFVIFNSKFLKNHKIASRLQHLSHNASWEKPSLTSATS